MAALTEDFIEAMRGFASENADVVQPVERVVGELRDTLAELAGRSYQGQLTSDDAKARQGFIQQALPILAGCIEGLTGVLLSGGVTRMESRKKAEYGRAATGRKPKLIKKATTD